MRRSLRVAVVVVGALGFSRSAAGKESCLKSCENEYACEIEVTRCLIDSNRSREAVERLKPVFQSRPEEVAWAKLLAWAYLSDDNTFWAERTLLTALERHPGDCDTVSWLVWVYLTTGDLELAQETVDTPGCPASPADKTRWHLLRLYLAQAKGDEDAARAHIENLTGSKQGYEEDRVLWRRYHRQENPGWIDPFSLKVETQAGYTSNARAGSPSDASGDGSGSGIGRFDLFGRFVAPVSKSFRPALEGTVKGHGLLHADVREISYLDFSLRPGFLIGDHQARVLAAYKGNLLLIGLDKKERYYESHRAELELEIHFGLLVFAGAGRRLFRENGRTRTELDLGVGQSVSVHKQVQLFFAITGRRYLAVGEPYDQMGGTALAAGVATLGPGVLLRLGVTPLVDYYPHSGGERGRLAYGTEEKRLDVLVRQFEEVWSPPVKRFRFGIRYEFSWRDSTADRPESNYDYTEHRVLGGIRWSGDLNPFGFRTVSSKSHVTLPHGVEERGNAFDKERIQDLLRQDEATRAGSSCVD